jgi:hypothetical protein
VTKSAAVDRGGMDRRAAVFVSRDESVEKIAVFRLGVLVLEETPAIREDPAPGYRRSRLARRPGSCARDDLP